MKLNSEMKNIATSDQSILPVLGRTKNARSISDLPLATTKVGHHKETILGVTTPAMGPSPSFRRIKATLHCWLEQYGRTPKIKARHYA
jgi:hypothetical protein